MEFAVVVEGNGGTNDKSILEGQISARVADVTEVLLSLTTVKNVMISMNEDSDLCKAFTLKGKFLSDPKFAFTLEAYANGTPAPNILPKEANRVLQSIIDY
jgi:hypothetical protein